MTVFDLGFLASVLLVFAMAMRIAVSAVRGKWKIVARSSRLLGLFLAAYTAVLIAAALALPRRFYESGERRCFDDWCAASRNIIQVKNASGSPCGPDSGGRDWIAVVEVSSTAGRVRQRAPDARAELEDREGRRYRPCAASGNGKSLSDPLDPGESFAVALPFRLPLGATPAGIVLHHGEFPEVVIIGSEQSFLRKPTLQRLAVDSR